MQAWIYTLIPAAAAILRAGVISSTMALATTVHTSTALSVVSSIVSLSSRLGPSRALRTSQARS